MKKIVLVAAMAACLGTSFAAGAATIVPDGPFSSSSGQIVVKTPSTFGAPFTCNMTLSGTVSGGIATISNIALSGKGFCVIPKLKNIPTPGWIWKANDLTNGTLSNVGVTLAMFPVTDCGPNTIAVKWDPASKTLSSTNQSLSGNCTVTSLSATFPTLDVQP
ncbi:alkane oxidation protein activator PraB [Pseudomonas piscis]|uniref:alkane oxidation protein activator PraB n=1 Tax=Pseudomonas piscis TaxID=2614538 RepID=UPI0021D578A0|nr:alkane oxidation protein activator PraB [Pseudomonas piscis]MCU7646369.1 protein activator of alkane oxidation PraB [Pseudomonas piscis]